MENKDFNEVLEGVTKLKANIKECGEVIEVLREIQRNYSEAIDNPKVLIKKAEELLSEIEKNYNSINQDVNDLNNKSKELVDTVENDVKEILSKCDSSFTDLYEKCDKIIKQIEKVIDSNEKAVLELSKVSKKLNRNSLIGIILTSITSVIGVVLLILQLI